MAYRCALKALHTYLPCETTPSLKLRELVSTLGVQRSEDARNLTSLRARRRSPGDLEQPPGNRRRKILYSSVRRDRGTAGIRRKQLWRCVMWPESEKVSGEVCKESLGSLSGCLVDGDAEQLARERRTRRRALAISIGLQSAVLTLLVLIPLFGKTERIVMRDYVPLPPYGHVSNHPRGNENHTTSR